MHKYMNKRTNDVENTIILGPARHTLCVVRVEPGNELHSMIVFGQVNYNVLVVYSLSPTLVYLEAHCRPSCQRAVCYRGRLGELGGPWTGEVSAAVHMYTYVHEQVNMLQDIACLKPETETWHLW